MMAELTLERELTDKELKGAAVAIVIDSPVSSWSIK